jgi:hypothetical protein
MAEQLGFSILPVVSHGEIPWTADSLERTLNRYDPHTLPNVEWLNDPNYRQFPREAESEYNVLLPGQDGRPAHVLRAVRGYRRNTAPAILDRITIAHQETLRLDQIGREEGIACPVLPYTTFLSVHDPYAQIHPTNSRSRQPTHVIYTLVEFIPGAQSLTKDHLRARDKQHILRALGRTQISYFEQLPPCGEALEDASGHHQYSTAGSLFDIPHWTSADPNTIGEDVRELWSWVRRILPSTEKHSMLKRLAILRGQYPVER